MAAPVDYKATIKPLLKQRCASCHGALKQEADLHATLLHLMGLDHTRLSCQHLGLDQRLTGVEQRHIVTKALA